MAALATLLTWLLAATACGGPRVNAQGFRTTLAGIEGMTTAAEAGDLKAALKAFWDVHDFFHAVDKALRQKDPELAQALWDAVHQIELPNKDEQARLEVLRREGRQIQLYLRRGATLLGVQL